MNKEIKKLIDSMDVKQDRENAESKAYLIFELEPDASDRLIEMAITAHNKSMDTAKKKKLIRAIIFTLSIFVKKKDKVVIEKLKKATVKHFLYKLSSQGYESAMQLLHNLGIFDSDILKEQLLSLLIVEKHIHDKEISINEALEEIKISKTYRGFKGIQNSCYMLGFDGRRSNQIYRIGKNLFGLRSLKTPIK
jgi:hypothetical protein